MSSIYKIKFTNATTLEYTFDISEVSINPSSSKTTPTSPPVVTSVALNPSKSCDFLPRIRDGTLPSFFVRATATICTKEGFLPLTYQTVVDFSGNDVDGATAKGKCATVVLERMTTPVAPHIIVSARWNVTFETIEKNELQAQKSELTPGQNEFKIRD